MNPERVNTLTDTQTHTHTPYRPHINPIPYTRTCPPTIHTDTHPTILCEEGNSANILTKRILYCQSCSSIMGEKIRKLFSQKDFIEQ